MSVSLVYVWIWGPNQCQFCVCVVLCVCVYIEGTNVCWFCVCVCFVSVRTEGPIVCKFRVSVLCVRIEGPNVCRCRGVFYFCAN